MFKQSARQEGFGRFVNHWDHVTMQRGMPKRTVYAHMCIFQREALSAASRLKASGREEGEETRSFVETLLVSEKY